MLPLRPLLARVPVLAVLVAAFSPGGCAPGTVDAQEPDEVLLSESPPGWFEAYFTGLEVAPDGGRAFFDARRLVDLTTGTEVPVGDGLSAVFRGTFDLSGRPVVAGRRGGETGWFRIDEPDGEPARIGSAPPGPVLVWSPSGELLAHGSGSDRAAVLVGPADASSEPRAHPLPGALEAAAWTDTGLLVLVSDDQGVGSLHELDTSSGAMRSVAEALDGPAIGRRLAVSDDGRSAYLALASEGAPDPEARHDPHADRDLDIWEIDLDTGERRPVVRTPAEELAPAFAAGALHWVAIETRMEVVLVPAEGGEAWTIAEGVQGPTWRPDSRGVGVTTGDWRVADWALNLDGGVVEIDAHGRATSPVVPIITGYHEDFSPVWSPDGSWIAYHSHRSAGPVAAYAGDDITDDIYVRRPDAPTSEEIRLTDFGWEVGTPDWAPDGRRLLMDSWDENGGASAWIVEMDPITGAALGRTRVPPPEGARASPSWGAWSPTREEIALLFGSRGREAELWILAPDGADARRIVTFEGLHSGYGGVDWSADGESLIYSALVDGRAQLFSVPRAGGEPHQLTDDAMNLIHPRVSPDGRWVAATRIRTERRILRR